MASWFRYQVLIEEMSRLYIAGFAGREDALVFAAAKNIRYSDRYVVIDTTTGQEIYK